MNKYNLVIKKILKQQTSIVGPSRHGCLNQHSSTDVDLIPRMPPTGTVLPEFSASKSRLIKMADRLVPLSEKRLMDVKLGELPAWAATRDFTPNGILAAIRRGHDRYQNKYINVRKGGIGGVAMILAGYVILSYVWEYDHIKHDRWRKYH